MLISIGSSDFTKTNTCLLGVQYSTANDLHCERDPVKSRGIEWISDMDGKFAENLNNP